MRGERRVGGAEGIAEERRGRGDLATVARYYEKHYSED